MKETTGVPCAAKEKIKTVEMKLKVIYKKYISLKFF